MSGQTGGSWNRPDSEGLSGLAKNLAVALCGGEFDVSTYMILSLLPFPVSSSETFCLLSLNTFQR